MQEENFDDLVHSNWKNTGSITSKLKHMKSVLRNWNRDKLGKMSERVSEAYKELEYIQLRIQSNPQDPCLTLEENKDQHHLIKVLKEEELFAKQKARALQISAGDSNTRYFYNAMAVRNARNGIHKIDTLHGTLTNSKEIAKEAVKFFSEAANPVNRLVIPKIIPFKLKLRDPERIFLDRDYTEDEVKKAIMEAHPEKALRPDGFFAIFYQRFWDLVSNDVFKSTLNFFSSFKYPESWATNFLSLIPKKLSPITFADYRPISLSNFHAKIVSKMMAIV